MDTFHFRRISGGKGRDFSPAWFGDTVMGLVFAYGIVGGFGVGFAYVTPIATCIKWFPDKRGMIVGLAVMGFGVGPLVFGPLLEALIGADPARLSVTIPHTFLILSGIFLVGVIGAAQLYRIPPPGWTPPNWSAAAKRGGIMEAGPRQMIATWQFYALWLLYLLGTSVGLTAIGEATPLLKEMASSTAIMSAGAALGVMSIFNGLGRLGWGAVSDRFGRKATLGMCIVSAAACSLFLRNATQFIPLLIGLCLVAFSYGGYLALMPSFTADFYGPKNVGANYGLLFQPGESAGLSCPGISPRSWTRREPPATWRRVTRKSMGHSPSWRLWEPWWLQPCARRASPEINKRGTCATARRSCPAGASGAGWYAG